MKFKARQAFTILSLIPSLLLSAFPLSAKDSLTGVVAGSDFYTVHPLFNPHPVENRNWTISRFGPVGIGIDLVAPKFTMKIRNIEKGSPADAYFSPGDECLHRIRRLFGEARQTLDICVFTITDNRIVQRLEEAHERGITIRIISDDDKSLDLGSDLEHLARIGIQCRLDRTTAHMHHKFAIADHDLLLSGSYNWTRSAATENDENIVVINNPKIVRIFAEKFEQMWQRLG